MKARVRNDRRNSARRIRAVVVGVVVGVAVGVGVGVGVAVVVAMSAALGASSDNDLLFWLCVEEFAAPGLKLLIVPLVFAVVEWIGEKMHAEDVAWSEHLRERESLGGAHVRRSCW